MAQHAVPEQSYHPQIKSSRYVPALDGLRAFAVLAVIAYHMGLGWAPGGLMGVTVFFVISGYLINGLLVAERENTGTINMKAFWMRRIRRLFPAILLAVVGTAALCTLFDHALLDKMRDDIIPSLFFYNNWWQIFRDLSYFQAAGEPSPIMHFWSLSIEEQFYVVWPLLLLLMYKLGLGKTKMSRVAFALAAFSAIEMALLYNPQADPSRIYYGTDTRAMSLLLGVWLSFVWPSAAFGKEPEVEQRSKSTWLAFNVAGVAALGGLVLVVAFTNGYSAFPYLGGTALTSVLAAALIAVLAVPDTWVARLFALKPLVWIGKRSYGMYLWHFPILLLTTNGNSTTGTPLWMHAIQLVLIFAVAELSYTFVEDPIRKGAIGEWWRNRKQQAVGAHAGHDKRQVIPAATFCVLLAVGAIGVVAVPPSDYAATIAGQDRAGKRADGGKLGAVSGGGEGAGGEGSALEALASEDAGGMPEGASEAGGADSSQVAGSPETGYSENDVVEGVQETDPEGQFSQEGQFGGEAASSEEEGEPEGEFAPETVSIGTGSAGWQGEQTGDSDAASAEGPEDQAGEDAALAEGEGLGADAEESHEGESNPTSAEPAGDAKAFETLIETPRKNAAGEPVYEPLLIGDSVAAGAEAAFYEAFPNGLIDAEVSRNIWESPYPSYLESDQVGDFVVFCLGTNNAVVDWQINDELLGPVGDDKKVVLVNTRNTQDWCAQTNAALAAAPDSHENVTVVDWFGASEGHDEYFAGDGTHLTEEGAAAYIALIREELERRAG